MVRGEELSGASEDAGQVAGGPGATPAPPPEDGARRLWDRASLALLGLVLALLCHSAWRVGPTVDEHYYAGTGLAYVVSGDFSLNREHPPLLKVLMGLPLYAAGVRPSEHWRGQPSYQASLLYGSEAEHLQRNFFLARLPMALLTLALAVGVWRVARRWFGPRAGFAGAAFLGLNPTLLGHGPQAALDVGATALIFFALVAFLGALERPHPARTLLAAILFGLANLAKYTALFLGPALIVLALLAAGRARAARPLLVLAQVLFGGLTVFAAGYLFEARAINEAWSGPGYRGVVPRAPIAAPELASRLGARLADAGPWRALLAQAAGDPSAEAALERVLAALGAERAGRAADDLAGALAALEDGPGPLRRRAVETLLETPGSAVDPELALALVPRLAERTLLFPRGLDPAERLERWRAWLDAERFSDWNERILAAGALDRLTRGLLGDTRPIPLLTTLKGLDFQLQHAERGHSTYFRGRVMHPLRDFDGGNPHPEYYSVLLGIKNPLGFLAAVALGLLLALARPVRFGGLRLAACVGFPLFLMLVFSGSNMLMGVRYVLPVFPFLALLAARLVAAAPRLGLGLALVAALEVLWIHPHELMYYNVLAGGPRGGPAISPLSDDLGQGVLETAAFLERHRAQIAAAGGLHYNPYSHADPFVVGLGESSPHRGPVEGIVAVHVVDYFREPQNYGWLEPYEPFTRLAWSVLVFDTRPGPPGGDPGWR